MKPFDLEAAKRGDPVVTRDGRNVRIICFDWKISSVESSNLICLVRRHKDVEDLEEIIVCNMDGSMGNGALFMASKKKEVWVRIYKRFDKERDLTFCSTDSAFYQSKEEAEKADCGVTLAIQKIEWEE